MKATVILVVVPVLVVSVLLIGAFNGFRFGDKAELPSTVQEVLTNPEIAMKIKREPGRLVIEVTSEDAKLQKQMQAAGLELEAMHMKSKPD